MLQNDVGISTGNQLEVLNNSQGEDGIPPSREVGKISYNFFNSHLAYVALKATAVIAVSAFLITTSALFLPSVPVVVPVIISIGLLVLFAKSIKETKKELIFEISFLYTVKTGGKDWWTPITDNIILGAMPLDSHMNRLKDEHKVTHILTMVEDFERVRCLICPASQVALEAVGLVNQVHAAPDFAGVPVEIIHNSVEFMHGVITNKDAPGKVYVHCKAGRGRSATVVVAYLLKYGHKENKFNDFNEAYTFVKNLRPQINLNPKQRAKVVEYWEAHCK